MKLPVQGTDPVTITKLTVRQSPVDTMALPLPTYQHWYETIHSNNVYKVRFILNNLEEPSDKVRRINGHFLYEEIDISSSVSNVITRPLFLAISFHSLDILDLFLEEGADVEITEDEEGYNLLHILVVISAYIPSKQDDMVQVMEHLSNKLPSSTLSKLIMGETTKGLRPLEFAAQQCTFGLMAKYLDIGLVVKRQIVGMMEYIWYDVTEYEFDRPLGRRHFSPMYFICNMDESALNNGFINSISHGQFSVWLDTKLHTHMFSYFFWLIMRVIQIVGIYVIDLDASPLVPHGGATDLSPPEVQANATFVFCHNFTVINLSPSVRRTLIIFLLVVNVYSVGFYIGRKLKTFRRDRFMYKSRNVFLPGKRNLIKQCLVYDASFVLFSAISITYTSCAIAQIALPLYVSDICRIFLSGWAIFSALYFIQVLQVVGPFIITIQRMLGGLAKFAMVFLIMQMPFVTLLAQVMNSHSASCIKDFNTIFDSFFTMFRIMLNAIDIKKYDIKYPYILDIIHMEYVFFVGILLLNFLIAVMANSVNEVEENKAVIMNVQRLSMVSELEETTVSIPTLHRWLLQKTFTSYNGRICIVCSRCYKGSEKLNQGRSPKSNIQ